MLHFYRRPQAPWMAMQSVGRALLLGSLVGLVGYAFRATAETLYDSVLAASGDARKSTHHLGVFAVGFAAALAFIVTAVAWTLRRYAPEAAGSGVQEVEAALLGHRPVRAWRVLATKFFGGILTLGLGVPLGREGPTIQMGGALGELLQPRRLGAPKRDEEGRNLALAAGAAAGLAAAFNAPLSGLMLILEEMRRQFRFSSRGLQFLALATLSAEITVRLLSGGQPVLPLGDYYAPSPATLPLFVLYGIPCGLLGASFNGLVLLGIDRLSLRALGLGVPMAWGAIVAGLWLWLPSAVGDGYDLMPSALAGEQAPWWLLGVIAVRIVATSGAFASGVPGGIFAPLVTVGVLLGCALGPWLRDLGVHVTNLQLAVAGIGGMFASMVQAPITGIVLAVELTGQLEASLALLATSIGAAATARMVGGQGIYDALAERLPPLSPSGRRKAEQEGEGDGITEADGDAEGDGSERQSVTPAR